MFDLGWSELFIVAVIALVVVGPKDLPGLLAKVGRFVGKARAMANQFQTVMMDAAREAELDEIKKELNQAQSIGSLDSKSATAADQTGPSKPDEKSDG